MPSRRIPPWLILTCAALGLIFLIPALWLFVSVTARPLHPDPAAVPTVSHSSPAPHFAAAASQSHRLALDHLVTGNLPGLSVAVGIGNEIVWAEGFGYADLRTGSPVTPDHRFRIGTASTALTSAAAGLLLEKSLLNLDAEIQTWVPSFPRKQWPVTLRHLMAHTSGLPDAGNDGPLFTKHCQQPAQALPYFAGEPLLFQPGTQTRYSSNGFILVSAAIEAASNQPFLDFMRTQIFEPLNMRHTTPDPAAAEPDDDFPVANLFRELIYDPRAARASSSGPSQKPVLDRVTPYYTRFASDPNYGLHLMRPLDYSCYAGAAVFVSTPSDLVRFGMANLPRSINGDSMGGMVASLLTIPERGIVVAVTSNISHANTSALALIIAQTFTSLLK